LIGDKVDKPVRLTIQLSDLPNDHSDKVRRIITLIQDSEEVYSTDEISAVENVRLMAECI